MSLLALTVVYLAALITGYAIKFVEKHGVIFAALVIIAVYAVMVLLWYNGLLK